MLEHQCYKMLIEDGLLEGSLKAWLSSTTLKMAFCSKETADVILAEVETCMSFSSIVTTVKRITSEHV